MKELTNREHWIDIARLLAIVTIIILHIPCYEKQIQYFLSIFNVAIFFIISGLLYHPQTLRNEIKKSFRSLIIPYIILGFINCIYWSLQYKVTDGISFAYCFTKYVKILFTTEIGLPMIGPLWFIIVLFLLRITMVKALHAYALLLISLLSIYMAYIIENLIPNSLFLAPLNYFLAMPFFAIGCFMQQYRHWLSLLTKSSKATRIVLMFIFFALTFTLFSYQGGNNMSMHNYGKNIITFYLCAILCSTAIFIISSLITIKSDKVFNILHILNSGLPLIIGLQIIMIDFIKRLIHIYAYHITGALILSLVIIAATYPMTMLSIRYFPHILGNRK